MSSGPGFTMSSGQGSGKRPVYVDLDAPEAMDVFNQVGSSSTPSSSSKGKKKKQSGYEKDDGYPSKEYTQFIGEVTISYYRIRSRPTLIRQFFENGHSGILALQGDLEREFWKWLDESE